MKKNYTRRKELKGLGVLLIALMLDIFLWACVSSCEKKECQVDKTQREYKYIMSSTMAYIMDQS